MIISILQLSDIHFKDNDNSIFSKIESMHNAIKNEIDTSEYLFLTFTGDVAFSGRKSEYNQAILFIEKLKEKILIYNNKINIECVFTPGNHDCDFTESQTIRNILIDNVIKDTEMISSEIVDQCTEIQNEYFEFINKLHSNKNINHEVSDKLFTRYEYELGEHKIAFNSYNLAWISKKIETQANIIYPTEKIDNNMISNENHDLTISIFHHPLHWLQHQNIRSFKELINSTSNIVLTGHEHTYGATKEAKVNSKDYIEYIEAGVLQDGKNKEISSFNLLNIKIDDKKQDIFEYIWNAKMYQKKNEHNNINLPFRKKLIYQLKEPYRKQINTMALKVSHPNKDDIALEDIFIYPHLDIIATNQKEKKTFLEFNSEKLKEINEIDHSIIYGADTSGKSSLCRILQLKHKANGFVPIIINGKDIKNDDSSIEKIKNIIKKNFKHQYIQESNTMSNFDQIDKNNVVLLIDDFHYMNLNSEYKSKFVENLLSLNYTNILFFAHDSLLLEGTTEGELAKSLLNFKQYKILEFGHKLREQIIKKWVLLGDNGRIEQKELILTVREKANSIDTTIGYNIVPSYPIYLLTLLQAMEANESNSLAKSAYGHYYEFLIMKYLNKDTPMQAKDINTIFTYTSTLAFQCLNNKQYTFTPHELSSFDKQYCLDKKFTPSFDIILKLLNSNIITEYDEELKFSHDYIYYFFVAKYLSDNISKSEIQKIITKMCKRLYRIEFANIIMFLIHHSPQDFILETIILEAKHVFEHVAEFTFSLGELKKINSSIKNERLELENRTLQESRSLELEEKEKTTKYNKVINENQRYEADYDEEIKDLNQFATLNLAFKVIEILGEITKNYSGSLDGKIKYDLIRETYSLGLRSLKSLVEFFENNHELLIHEIKSILEKKQLVTQDKKTEAEANIIFGMVSSISTGIVKRIAKSIASKDLSDIYIEILSEDKDNIAIQLINHAIELDFKNGLHVNKIEKLHKFLSGENNRLTDSVLKKMVLEHIYMFDIEFNKKQSICAKLEIGNDNANREMHKQLKK